MDNQDWPITAVVVVTDVSKCPPGYITIDKTFDRQEDADIWRDGIFGRRVYRYVCVERCAPQPGKDVLVDVTVINDRDPLPAGFCAVDYTCDTREKAMKKKVLCTRMMGASLTNSAISELIILAKGSKRPPNGYTMVGELNSLMLCYKMASIKVQQPDSNTLDMVNVGQNLPYTLNPTLPARQDNYSPAHQYSPSHQHDNPTLSYNTLTGAGTRIGPPERSESTLAGKLITPLSGVPWQLNPKLQELGSNKSFQIPEIRYKSMMDIENEYNYSFSTERAACDKTLNNLR